MFINIWYDAANLCETLNQWPNQTRERHNSCINYLLYTLHPWICCMLEQPLSGVRGQNLL